MSDRRNGVPTTVTSIPLVDPHAPKADPSIGDLVKDATAQVSTLVRAEVELAKAEITRDVKKGLTGSVFFILALVVLFYSTFFFFFFLAELLDTWLWRWAAFLIVFGVMVRDHRGARAARLSEGAPDPGPAADHRIGQGNPRGADARARQGPGASRRRNGKRPHRRSVEPPIRRAGRWPRPIRRWSASTVRGVISRCTPTGFASTSWRRNAGRRSRPRRGRRDRPLVILLHGFGSFWWSWRHQLRGLTGARVVAVDLRGYGGSDKPPRGYDGWTLAGDTAGLVRALGPQVGDAGRPRRRRPGLLGDRRCCTRGWCGPSRWSARRIPVALRASALTRRDQGLALLPWMLRYQVPMWPERSLTRNDAEELERLVRSRASGKWLASEDFSETIGHMRRAIQIPVGGALGAGVPALGGAQPAARRGPAVHAVDEAAAGVPVLHLRGDADPYVLADPVYRTQHYAPHGRYVSIAGAGHFGHEEAPEVVNEQLTRFLAQVYG